MRRRKLLFVSTMQATPWGGSEELWCAAAEEAIAAGHEVAISTFQWLEPAAKILLLAPKGAKLLTRPLNPSRVESLLAALLPRAGSPAWLGEHEAFKADAICLSQGAPYELVGRRASRTLLRWMMRQPAPIVNIVQFAKDHETLKASTAAKARALLERCAANRFVAAANITSVSKQVGMTVPRAAVIRNPVNLGDTSVLQWPATDSPARFACVARLVAAIKGQDTLLRVLGNDAWATRDWRLSLVGMGPDEGLLRALARELKIDHRVDFPGQVSDMRAMWREHHLLVLPSRAEGTPLAMVEAMLLGRPCVVTPVGGTPDWVGAPNGVLARSANQNDLAAALEEAWTRRAQWRSLGAQARSDATALHDPTPGKTLLTLMEQVAN